MSIQQRTVDVLKIYFEVIAVKCLNKFIIGAVFFNNNVHSS